MKQSGMTLIVKNVTRLVAGFVAVFGLFVALTGHLGPGGGFAGGVILASAAVLVVLAFGSRFSKKLITEGKCHVWDGLGAMGFIAVAMLSYLGFWGGEFFFNFISKGEVHEFASAGTIPLSNLAIGVKVAAGLAGAFIALAAFRRGRSSQET
ncbi:MAG: cation:proton antiporter [Phycisphaerae bacterium]|nr:cation:proton antiporter [Phycisphaerae bacterium]